jgi:hypothetical protein
MQNYIKSMKKFNFQWDDDEVRFVLDKHAMLDFYCASSLKQQSSDKLFAPFWHIILIPSQLVFLLNAVYLAEKQQIILFLKIFLIGPYLNQWLPEIKEYWS